jgi:hypothetical protein
MLVKMMQTRRGSEDGFLLKLYEEGRVYDMAHTLACRFINQGWAFNAEPSTSNEAIDEAMGQVNSALRKLDETQKQLATCVDGLITALRVQPARPTNPATLVAIGKLEA